MSSIALVRLAFLAALALAPSASFGETVELRSGETLVGSVRLEGADGVVIEATFPAAEIRTVRREDVAPESMHAILERSADPADAAKRREMGEFAEAHGLLALAIADFTAVKKLDPNSTKEMDARIDSAREQLAYAMLSDAQDLLDDGNANAALLYLHALREKYPHSDAAKKAESVAAAAHEAAGDAAVVATKTVSAADAPRVAKAVEDRLAKGDEARTGTKAHSDLRSAERAVTHYEAAWEAAKTLPVAASGNEEFDARVARLRGAARSKLVGAYLAAGTILLERRAIPGAEKYCNAACALDPENKSNHRLHELILQAKLLSYRGGAR